MQFCSKSYPCNLWNISAHHKAWLSCLYYRSAHCFSCVMFLPGWALHESDCILWSSKANSCELSHWKFVLSFVLLGLSCMYLKILNLLYHKVYEQRLAIVLNQLYQWYHLRGVKHCEQFQYMLKELWLFDSRLSLRIVSKYQNYCSKLLLLDWKWWQI